MRKYLRCFLLGLQSAMEYRLNFMLGLVTVIVPIGIQYFLWTTVYRSTGKTTIYHYGYSQMIVYTIMAAICSRVVGTGFENDIAGDIKNGGLSKYIVQPINYVLYRIFRFFGQKMLQSGILLVAGFIGVELIGVRANFILHTYLVLPFLITCTLALMLNCLISMNISLLAFWLSETSGSFAMTSMIVRMASGGVLPLDVFGKKVMAILHVLPFQYTIYFPVNVLNNKLTPNAIVTGVFMQLLWISILAMASIVVWKLGLKKYHAVGG